MSTISQQLLAQEYAKKFVIEKQLQFPRDEPTFKIPESSLIIGAPNAGKSRLLTRLELKYREICRAQIIDVFGAKNDAESTNHLLNPKLRDSTLILCGNEVEVKGWRNVIPIGKFDLDECSKYAVIITDRRFFGPKKNKKATARYYSALATIFEELSEREDPSYPICLGMREIANVVYSINKAGMSRDQQMAQEEFRQMHSMRYHSKIICVMDTQRMTDALASVRSLTDHIFLKALGRQPMPLELKWLWRPHLFGDDPYHGWYNPRFNMIRHMPVEKFIHLGPNNGVAIGWFADIPWHIKKGFSPMKYLNITVDLKPEEKTESNVIQDEKQESEVVPDRYMSLNEMHMEMIHMHGEGMTYKEIAAKFINDGKQMSWQMVAYHMRGDCSCAANSRRTE